MYNVDKQEQMQKLVKNFVDHIFKIKNQVYNTEPYI